VQAACGVLPDGNMMLVPPGTLLRRGLPDRLRQKVPSKAGSGLHPVGDETGAPATRRAFSALYKLRGNGPNSSLEIAELGRGPALVAWV
jgi:hypothetical protein